MRWISDSNEIVQMCKMTSALVTCMPGKIIMLTMSNGAYYQGIYSGGRSGNNGNKFSQFYSCITLLTLNGKQEFDLADVTHINTVDSPEEYQKYIDAGIITNFPKAIK